MEDLKSVINESLHPFLKSHRFKKKGMTWNRERGEFVDVINVQKAKYAIPGNEIFTINLGVFVKWMHEVVWEKPKVGIVADVNCPVRARLGDLIQSKPFGNAYDQWWTVTEDFQNNQVTSHEVLDALRDKGIIFLEKFKTHDAIVTHMRQVVGWLSTDMQFLLYQALLEWKIGNSSVSL